MVFGHKVLAFLGIIWKVLEKNGWFGIELMALDFWLDELKSENKKSDMRGGLLLKNRQPGWFHRMYKLHNIYE